MENFYTLLKRKAAERGACKFLQIDSAGYTYDSFLDCVDGLSEIIEKELAKTRLKTCDSLLVLAKSFLLQGGVFFALQRLGIIPVLAHPELSQDEMASIAGENHLSGQLIVSLESGVISVEIHETEVIEASRKTEGYCPDFDDVMGALSSGSTGTPKVMYRTYDSWAGFFGQQNQVFGIKDDSRLFINGSLSFTGNLNMLVAQLAAGGEVITSDASSVKAWYQLLAGNKATHIYMVPAKLQLLSRAMSDKKSLDDVLAVVTGSQLMTNKIKALLKKAFPFSTLILYYGASELSYITYRKGYEALSDSRNLGRPFDGIKLSIRNDEIFVDTPFHVSGVAVPFSAGDTGAINEAGELVFFGRNSDWINKGGYKISCVNLENQIKRIPHVMDVAVLAIDDMLRGQDSVAFVVKEAEISQQECRLLIRQTIDAKMLPKKIVFLDEIPLNDRGKIDKQILRSML